MVGPSSIKVLLATEWGQYFDIGFDITEDTWYTISTSIRSMVLTYQWMIDMLLLSHKMKPAFFLSAVALAPDPQLMVLWAWVISKTSQLL
jgi:hypothetical protein